MVHNPTADSAGCWFPANFPPAPPPGANASLLVAGFAACQPMSTNRRQLSIIIDGCPIVELSHCIRKGHFSLPFKSFFVTNDYDEDEEQQSRGGVTNGIVLFTLQHPVSFFQSGYPQYYFCSV
jgi:hypothetical protein